MKDDAEANKIGEVKVSTITDPEQIMLCYQGLEKGLMHFEEKTDVFTFFGDKRSRETSFKESREIAGRLCSRIVALLLADADAEKGKKMSAPIRYKMEFINNRMITDYFTLASQLKL